MLSYVLTRLNQLNQFVLNSTNLFEDTITIDTQLSLLIYKNEKHTGEKINPFILRNHTEPTLNLIKIINYGLS